MTFRLPRRFPYFPQRDRNDCAVACLRMISASHGKILPRRQIADALSLTSQGATLQSILRVAKTLGFSAEAYRVAYDELASDFRGPVIVHCTGAHYVVLYKVSRHALHVADPAIGKYIMTPDEFRAFWSSTPAAPADAGMVVMLQPGPGFERQVTRDDEAAPARASFLHFAPYKRVLAPVLVLTAITAGCTFLLPKLTGMLYAATMSGRDSGLLGLFCIGAALAVLGTGIGDATRRWYLFFAGRGAALVSLSRFIRHTIDLPLLFFQHRSVGDSLQRMQEQRLLQDGVGSTAPLLIHWSISYVSLVIVLLLVHATCGVVFLAASGAALLWVVAWSRRRRGLRVSIQRVEGENQSSVVQMFQRVPDIKIHALEKPLRWRWERLQSFHQALEFRNLSLEQKQFTLPRLALQMKDFLILYLAATAVTRGALGIDKLLVIQFVVGQLHAPVDGLINIVRMYQDLRVSKDRVNEFASERSEHEGRNKPAHDAIGDLTFHDVNFTYDKSRPDVLRNVSFTIEQGQTTAIVGASGSGKTTIINLLLGLYTPRTGAITIGAEDLRELDLRSWRRRCGVVMQNGSIFRDTVAANIALPGQPIDLARLKEVARIAQADEFLESLPQGYSTILGSDDIPLSIGQRQRLLWARALYYDPDYLFVDEATNALDSKTEERLQNEVGRAMAGKTLVVVAHRLSSIRNAHRIVVLAQGRVVETGSHHELASGSGFYRELCRLQGGGS